MDVVGNILGQGERESKIGTCELCEKKNTRVWITFGGTDFRCDECEKKYG